MRVILVSPRALALPHRAGSELSRADISPNVRAVVCHRQALQHDFERCEHTLLRDFDHPLSNAWCATPRVFDSTILQRALALALARDPGRCLPQVSRGSSGRALGSQGYSGRLLWRDRPAADL